MLDSFFAYYQLFLESCRSATTSRAPSSKRTTKATASKTATSKRTTYAKAYASSVITVVFNLEALFFCMQVVAIFATKLHCNFYVITYCVSGYFFGNGGACTLTFFTNHLGEQLLFKSLAMVMPVDSKRQYREKDYQ